MVALVRKFHAEAKPPAPGAIQRIQWHNITLDVPQGVYGPREDSFLLAGAVKKFARGRVLDMGTGSGISGIAAAKREGVKEVVCADISEAALRAARANAKTNGAAKKIKFTKSDLFSSFGPGEKFDTIAFNPPYLPTEPGEKKFSDSHAWDGGKTGRKIIDKFLAQFPAHLAPGGTLLLLSSSLSGDEKTLRTLKQMGFAAETVSSESFFFEKISVVKAQKAE